MALGPCVGGKKLIELAKQYRDEGRLRVADLYHLEFEDTPIEGHKNTKVFDELDNVLGNYAEGKATSDDVAKVAERVNRYCHEHPHPDDMFQNLK